MPRAAESGNAWVAVLLMGGALRAAAPSPQTAPAALPSTIPAAAAPASQPILQAGDSVSTLLNAMSARFSVIVVMREPVKALLVKSAPLPDKLDEAMALAQETLEPQGYGIIRTVSSAPDPHIVLRIAPLKEAKQAALEQGPVTAGADPAAIDVTNPDQPVTHLLPIHHAELLDALHRSAAQDKDVTVSQLGTAATGFTFIVQGPAAKVKKAVQAVVAVDRAVDDKPIARMITLRHLNATESANTLNQSFAPGSGLTAVADRRTNSVIVTGPEPLVIQAMMTLGSMDISRTTQPSPGMPDTAPAATEPAKSGARTPAADGPLDGIGLSGDNPPLHTTRRESPIWPTGLDSAKPRQGVMVLFPACRYS